MTTADHDIQFLKLAVNDLGDYLTVKEIFWPLPEAGHAAGVLSNRLSLGALLFAHSRLHARHLDDAQTLEVDSLDQRINDGHTRWQAHWDSKAAQEFPVRMRLWRNYLEEYRQDPPGSYRAYSREVDRRVMLQLLGKNAPIPVEEQDRLQQLDDELTRYFIPGPFVWSTDLQDGFPPDLYWFLYGSLAPDGVKGIPA